LPKSKAQKLHNVTAQGLLCKHKKPDISPVIVYLTMRVRSNVEDDWD